MERLLVIGLDCVPMTLLQRFRAVMPNISALMEEGLYGNMKTCYPPITVPAWAVMATGRQPGEMGIYGFRHRRTGTYNDMYIITSKDLRVEAVWHKLARKGRRSILVSFPPSYPPPVINGISISDFHTPSTAKNYTFPPWIRSELEKRFGRFIFDVEFRVEDRDPLVGKLFEMTEQHFKVVRYLSQKKWDLLWYVEIGPDRLHHAFWKFFDPEHPKHVPGNKYEDIAERYYRMLDEKVGELLSSLKVPVLIVSDHGAKPMHGAFVINEWLADNGYLKFEMPEEKRDISEVKVDWDHTVAWGWGGYYSRIFINLKGREPNGKVSPEDYDSVVEQIRDDLSKVSTPDGRTMRNIVHRPHEVYREVRGDYPDLMLYVDDLNWRAAGTVGYRSWYLPENDKGPDDAMHDWHGIYIAYDPEGRLKKGKEDREIYDIRPLIERIMEIEG